MGEGSETVGRVTSLNQIGIRDGQVWIVAEEKLWRRAFGSIPSHVDIDVDSYGSVRVCPGVNYEVQAWAISQESGGSPKHFLASRRLKREARRVRSASAVTSKIEVKSDQLGTQAGLAVSVPSDAVKASIGAVGAVIVMVGAVLIGLHASRDNNETSAADNAMTSKSQHSGEYRAQATAEITPRQVKAIADLVSEASANESELVKVLDQPDEIDTSLIPIEVGSKTDKKTTLSWYSDRGVLIFGSVIDRQGRDLTRLVKSYGGMVGGQVEGAKTNRQRSPDLDNELSGDISSGQGDDSDRSKQASNEQAAKEMVWPLSRVYEQIEESASYFPNNDKKGRYIYVFVDPQCPYCEALYSEIMTSEGLDTSLVRWVPVAVLGRSSLPKAAAVLSTGAAAESLDVDMEETDRDLAEKIVENTRVLLYSADEVATPTLIWRGEDGVESYVGSPSKSRLKAIFDSVSDANGGHNDERGSAAS